MKFVGLNFLNLVFEMLDCVYFVVYSIILGQKWGNYEN